MAFGTQELVIVLVAFFILFGAERLPKLARSMGQAKGEFHEGLADVKKAGDTTEEAVSYTHLTLPTSYIV